MTPQQVQENWKKEFDKLWGLYDPSQDSDGLDKKIRDFIADLIHQTQQKERARFEEIIEKFSDRDDDDILKDIGKSASFPAPCSRKTCNLILSALKNNE